MTATITGPASSIFPTLVMDYETVKIAKNVFHEIIGKSEPDVSLELDPTRAGTLNLFFEYKADAWDAYTALATGIPFALSDSETPEVNMSFARDGRMTMRLTGDRKHWVIEMEYRETV